MSQQTPRYEAVVRENLASRIERKENEMAGMIAQLHRRETEIIDLKTLLQHGDLHCLFSDANANNQFKDAEDINIKPITDPQECERLLEHFARHLTPQQYKTYASVMLGARTNISYVAYHCRVPCPLGYE